MAPKARRETADKRGVGQKRVEMKGRDGLGHPMGTIGHTIVQIVRRQMI